MPVSVLLGEGSAFVSGGGAELEEGLGSVSLQAGEESAVPVVAHREELRALLGSRLPNHPWVTHGRLTDVPHC